MDTGVFIQLIGDYGVGDGAFGEIVQKLIMLDPTVRVNTVSVPKFSTLATGFWTVQYALVNPVPGMVIYTNTAPRKDKKEAREKGEGEGLVYTKLKNGVEIVGVNAGYCFSFIKPHTQAIYAVNVANKGSQFRSRDFYPEAVIGIARRKKEFIGASFSLASIPDVPDYRVAYIDGYGNMKTTVRSSSVHFKPGQPVLVSMNGLKRTAYFTDGTFSVNEGELAFAPGSSGGEDRFMELFLRGLSAWKEFGKPSVESPFSVEPA